MGSTDRVPTIVKKSFKCKICKRIFPRNYRLQSHLRWHRKQNIKLKRDLISDPPQTTNDNVQKEVVPSSSDNVTDESETNLVIVREELKNWVKKECETCEKVFESSRDLKRHLLTHSKEKPFVCSECGKGFALKGNLTTHIKIHEKADSGNDEPQPETKSILSCEVCGRVFNYRSFFERHLLTHTKEKPYVCDVCGKGFAHKGNLTVHNRIHQDLEPFVCYICGKNFKELASLKKHVLCHASVMPHICNLCGKGYTSKCYLDRHYLSHSGEKPHVCSICGRGFAHKGNLTVHERNHQQNLLYYCHVCEVTYVKKTDFCKHFKQHSTKQTQQRKVVYSCNVCEQTFLPNDFSKHSLQHATGLSVSEVKVSNNEEKS